MIINLDKKIFIISLVILLLCLPFFMEGKNIEVTGEFKTIQYDNTGFIYATSRNTVYKYNDEGKLLCSYNYSQFGTQPSIDVSTPMRVFLYFADYKKIIILDSRLSEIRRIDASLFSDLENPTIACFSKDQNIWMYNATRFTLLKIDNVGNRIYESQSLSTLTEKNIQPIQISEQKNNVFLNDTSNGILVFNILGTYIKTIPIKGVSYFEVHEGKLYFYTNHQLQSIDIQSYELQTYKTKDDENVRSIILNKGKFVSLSSDKFSISTIE